MKNSKENEEKKSKMNNVASIKIESNTEEKKQKENKNIKKQNPEMVHIVAKKQALKNRHKTEKNNFKMKYKNLFSELKLQYKKDKENSKKNIKESLKTKKLFQINYSKIKKEYNLEFNVLKDKHLNEKNNIKLEILDYKLPVSTNRTNDKINSLLLEKQKEKRNKLLVEKTKKNYKIIFKNIPIRLFKEIKRVRWGSSDTKIGIKFVQVLVLVSLIALFILGIEEALNALLKLMKLSLF